jgi:hypothetical protein
VLLDTGAPLVDEPDVPGAADSIAAEVPDGPAAAGAAPALALEADSPVAPTAAAEETRWERSVSGISDQLSRASTTTAASPAITRSLTGERLSQKRNSWNGLIETRVRLSRLRFLHGR